MKNIKIYTDGSCKVHTTKQGGWAYIILENDKIISENLGYENDTTSNRMEMLAVIKSLHECYEIHYDKKIELMSDSKLIVNGFEWISSWKSNGWITSTNDPVKNRDLWEEIDSLNEYLMIDIKWVKGHENDQFNNFVDSLCKMAESHIDPMELNLN